MKKQAFLFVRYLYGTDATGLRYSGKTRCFYCELVLDGKIFKALAVPYIEISKFMVSAKVLKQYSKI